MVPEPVHRMIDATSGRYPPCLLLGVSSGHLTQDGAQIVFFIRGESDMVAMVVSVLPPRPGTESFLWPAEGRPQVARRLRAARSRAATPCCRIDTEGRPRSTMIGEDPL